MEYEIIATTSFGIESVAAREIKRLGIDNSKTENGRIIFSGSDEEIAKANIFLRTVDRVFIRLASFKATSFEELFQGVKKIPFEKYIDIGTEFPVTGKCVRSKLMSIRDCQSIIKKAVVERLKQTYNVEYFKETEERLKIFFSITKDVVEIMLDTSGDGLHKRGYRTLTSTAPLRETMAAAMILLTRWNSKRCLTDLCCGSGTIPIEAALISRNIAPGINRNFDFEKWKFIDYNVIKTVRKYAIEGELHNDDKNQLRITGIDINPEVLKLARYHAERAGVSESIHFQQMDLNDYSTKYKYGFFISNPPYGERIGEMTEAEELYKDFRDLYKKYPTWSMYLITSHGGFENLFEKKANKKRKLYNGGLLCYYYQYYGEKPPIGIDN